VDATGTAGVLIVLLYAWGLRPLAPPGRSSAHDRASASRDSLTRREARPGASLAPPRRGGGY